VFQTSKVRRTAPAVHDMSIKVQYNPSTGLVSYNAVTRKQQVHQGIPPGFCSNCKDNGYDTPLSITVAFTGVIRNSGCSYCSNFAMDNDWVDVPNINTSFILELDSGDQGGACSWDYRLLTNGTRDFYPSSDASCTGSGFAITWDNLFVRVTRQTSGVYLQVLLMRGVNTVYTMFSATYTMTNCVTGAGANSRSVATNCSPSYGGTFTVTEII